MTPFRIHRYIQAPLLLRVAVIYGVFFTLLSWPLVSNMYATSMVKPTPSAATNTVQVKSQAQIVYPETPHQLHFPRLDIRLAVGEGLFDPATNEWSLNDTDAFFMPHSSAPNTTSGQTLIYGHNTVPVFGRTAWLVQGDEVYITTQNYTFVYIYKNDKYVTPNDVSILTETSTQPQLALLTCNGAFDEHRRIMYFSLKEVTSL
mgnify:CR=1 FL=1